MYSSGIVKLLNLRVIQSCLSCRNTHVLHNKVVRVFSIVCVMSPAEQLSYVMEIMCLLVDISRRNSLYLVDYLDDCVVAVVFFF